MQSNSARTLPYQWSGQYNSQAMNSSTLRGLSADQRRDSAEVADDVDQMQATLHATSNMRISNKLNETEKLTESVEQVLAAVIDEACLLEKSMADTDEALKAKSEPTAGAYDWLKMRANRPPSEAIYDPVERSLEALLAALFEAVRLLESTLAAENGELARLRQGQAALEADIDAKKRALAIDTDCRNLEEACGSMRTTASVVVPSVTATGTSVFSKQPYDPVQWRGSSATIMFNAKKVMAVSARLRKKAADLVCQTNAAVQAALAALRSHHATSIENIKEAIMCTEDEIARCTAEIQDNEDAFAKCDDALVQKQQSSQLAQERLALRSTRPARERVQDPAQTALQNELAEMMAASQELAAQKVHCLTDKRKLEGAKAKLEHTLFLKTEFLKYEEQCAAITIPVV